MRVNRGHFLPLSRRDCGLLVDHACRSRQRVSVGLQTRGFELQYVEATAALDDHRLLGNHPLHAVLGVRPAESPRGLATQSVLLTVAAAIAWQVLDLTR